MAIHYQLLEVPSKTKPGQTEFLANVIKDGTANVEIFETREEAEAFIARQTGKIQ